VSESKGYSAEYDIRYLEAGLLDLEGYLLSREIYWPVGASAPAGGPPYPRLTLGNLLLSRARLGARPLSPAQTTQLERLDRQLEEKRSQWRAAWGHKAQLEFHHRLNLWRDFLEEYRQNASGNADRYAYESRRRVLLEFLESEAGSIPAAEKELLSGLDLLLKGVFVPGPFIWEPELQDAFPAGKYWYLYGWLRSEE
jgi:hypothetical protein